MVTLPIKVTKEFRVIRHKTKAFGREINAWAVIDNDGTVVRDFIKEEKEALNTSQSLNFEENNKFKGFKSSHFDEPNILVHLRMNTRTDAQGNKVLFLEEVQSDWGQTGKREGFKEEFDAKDYTILEVVKMVK